ncbi:Mut7-C RNAse domain-containing protein [Ramlibacter humi]|uniref:Mut7-C RNAse domain-containing protein n=1 Tax=Ramlibacter humi TaxID=2530451 RepID=UPI001431E973|nr:Mut7-C RNAse domain-containing protein [Ramlibacter humi]
MTAPAQPKFAADAMLARLARWLRVLGWDTTLQPGLDDTTLVRQANEEGRILLTRDRGLLRDLRPDRFVEVHHDGPLEQLRQVVRELNPEPPHELFTRCTVCNTELSPPLSDAERAARLPPDVRELPGPARACPGCGRLYWRGSHAKRMRTALAHCLTDWLPREVL